jgi:hypothetical protein
MAWAIDRLGRSLIDLLGTIQTLEVSGDYPRWLSDEPNPRVPDATVPTRADTDVADLDARQQAGKRRPIDRRADRVSYFGGVTVPLLRFFGVVRVATLIQIARIKPFGKPAVDRSEEISVVALC